MIPVSISCKFISWKALDVDSTQCSQRLTESVGRDCDMKLIDSRKKEPEPEILHLKRFSTKKSDTICSVKLPLRVYRRREAV